MLKATSKLKKLPLTLENTVASFLTTREVKRGAEAAARAAEKSLKGFQSRILQAMGGDEAATCGDYLILLKREEPVEAQLTLVDQTKVRWSDVTRVIVGNREIKRAEVAGIYGGKSGPVTLIISKRAT